MVLTNLNFLESKQINTYQLLGILGFVQYSCTVECTVSGEGIILYIEVAISCDT